MQNVIVAQRELDKDEDVVTLTPVYLVADAPDDVTAQEVKDVLQKCGEAEYHGWNWRDFTVVLEEKTKGRNWTVSPIEEWVGDNYKDIHEDIGMGSDGNVGAAAPYDYLVDLSYDEVRVSLRLPKGLHSALKRAAGEMPLNSYCLAVLAKEVGETELVAKFEADRPKPGRPKKAGAGR